MSPSSINKQKASATDAKVKGVAPSISKTKKKASSESKGEEAPVAVHSDDDKDNKDNKDEDKEDEDQSPTVSDLLDSFLKIRQEQQTFQKSELELLRNIKKVYKKEIRVLAKSRGKKSRKGVKRAPSGIATNKYISPQLCEFLGEPIGTRLPRTVVTARLTAYVKQKNLLGREGHLKKDGTPSKQFITPNAELKELIGDPSALNFFSLQTALNPHFVEPV